MKNYWEFFSPKNIEYYGISFLTLINIKSLRSNQYQINNQYYVISFLTYKYLSLHVFNQYQINNRVNNIFLSLKFDKHIQSNLV